MTIKEAIYKLAIEAIEKQISQKWMTEKNDMGDMLWTCPECNCAFKLEEGTPKEHDYNYCPACGQALKWEEG